MQVLEHEQHGRSAARAREQLGHLVEQPQPRGAGSAAGSACSSPSGRSASTNGANGPSGSSLQRPASTVAPAACAAPRGLGDQPRLADPGLADDEHDVPLAAADAVERGEQPVALDVAPDERRPLAPGREDRGQRRRPDRVRVAGHLASPSSAGASPSPVRIRAASSRVARDGAMPSSLRSRSASRS